MDEIPNDDLKEMDMDEMMNSDVEDDESDASDEGDENDTPKEAFIPGRHKVEKDEELVRDESAYTIYHEFQTGAPCLSFDVINDDLNRGAGEYPMSAFIVAGTMSQSAKDHIIVLKLANMHETKNENNDEDDEEEDEARKPKLHAAMVRHSGCVNRIRVKNFGDKVLAANWSERAEVHIWDLEEQLKATHDRQSMNNFIHTKQKNIKPVFTFSGYRNEGYALDWSDVQPGHMLTGDNGKNIHYWKPVENCVTEWAVEQRSYVGHTAAVEDIQWSPNESSVFASCSTDKSIRVWDVRANPSSACMIAVDGAHDLDINVISWNKKEPFIVSGGDDGVIKVWDLRQIQEKKSVATFKQHSAPITSIEWCPQDSSVFAASGEDNQITQWDLAVEREGQSEEPDVPPQLLFVHQGQDDIKEIHWHRQIEGLMISTANSGFNIFKTISV